MNTAIFSIKPQFAHAILSGAKTWEYRKVCCKRPIGRIIIYATSPDSCIVGEVSVLEVITGTPAAVWAQTGAQGGIPEQDYLRYFGGSAAAYAYRLQDPLRYGSPRALADYGIASPPQSFVYLARAGCAQPPMPPAAGR